MSTTQKITSSQVKHIAALANLEVSDTEAPEFAAAFSETLDVVDQLHKLDTSGIDPTHQVTGLENVLREDEVDEERMFSQEEALSNAPKTHDGFFVVPRIIED